MLPYVNIQNFKKVIFMKKKPIIKEEYFEDYDLYTEQGIEECYEGDEINESEYGFMLGYLAA